MTDTAIRHGWIDLLLPDGPFLSAAAMDKTTVGENWPTRLDADQRNLLLAAPVSESEAGWDDSDWECRRNRVEQLLTDLLGYKHGHTLHRAPALTAKHHIYRTKVRADFSIHSPGAANDIRMVVMCGPDAWAEPAQFEPSRTSDHDGWVSTPVQRAALLARHAGAGLALVSNGRQHLSVNVVTGTTGYATWTINALEERAVQDAFVALLHSERVLHRSKPTSTLIKLSQDRQQELTDTLGRQVRRAAEVLVNAISRANRTTRGELLQGITGQQIYAATTSVLMRAVFLLVAEERGLLPVAENQLYADEYAISTLLGQLEDDEYRNRSAMQRRSGAWQRFLALSRSVHAGIDHDRLRLPAYGGSLFDPDEHPFLEGRVAAKDDEEGHLDGSRQIDVGVVDDYTTLTVLRHMQVANGQRISFRTLDVEQIGHVYESLLDHTVVMVQPEEGAILGLAGRSGEEPEISLIDLEEWAAEGRAELGRRLSDVNVAAEASGIYQALDEGLEPEGDVARTISIAVGNDELLGRRVEPYAPLLRTDARGVALIFLPGDFYVTSASSRRDSGTAYTPRALAAALAQETLDPLIFQPGPHDEADESKWKLRSPDALLGLRICDPAVGSAAILVAAARYLAEALLQSRIEYGLLPADALDTGATDAETLDVRIQAHRDVVSNCIYGVDRDAMAVEMAKLSLWLVTVARDKPFTFLDHAIRHGDSLLGVASLRQLQHLHLNPEESPFKDRGGLLSSGGEVYEWRQRISDNLSRAAELRAQIRELPVDSLAGVHTKASLNAQAEAAVSELRLVADALTGASLSTAALSRRETASALTSIATAIPSLDDPRSRESLAAESSRWLEAGNPSNLHLRRPMHWPLEFPDVLAEGRKAFDAMLGNPPWIGTKRQAKALGESVRQYCVKYIAGMSGQVDVATYFIRRAARLADAVGFLLTRKVIEGDDPRVGVGVLLDSGWVVDAATSVRPWPTTGSTMPFVSASLRRGSDPPTTLMDGVRAPGSINSRLRRGDLLDGPLFTISGSSNVGYLGVYLNDKGGFLVDPDDARRLHRENPLTKDYLKPYVSSSTIGQEPRCIPAQYAIDLSVLDGVPLEVVMGRVAELVELCRRAIPHRRTLPDSKARVREHWWLPEAKARDLREALDEFDGEYVPVLGETCRALVPILLPVKWCFSKGVFVFPATNHLTLLGFMQGYHHQFWIMDQGAKTAGGTPRYGRRSTNLTMPYPEDSLAGLEPVSESLDAQFKALMDAHGLGLTDVMGLIAKDDRNGTVRDARTAMEKIDAIVESYVADRIGAEPRRSRYSAVSTPVGARWWPDWDGLETRDRLVRLNYAAVAKAEGITFDTVLKRAGHG